MAALTHNIAQKAELVEIAPKSTFMRYNFENFNKRVASNKHVTPWVFTWSSISASTLILSTREYMRNRKKSKKKEGN